ncbi:MAG: hypothetical protein K6E29_05305 [Cyanobacteria bacterium RUI128]|nr:hypothetical protein [Cyanobacteria bacterium RUI128]
MAGDLTIDDIRKKKQLGLGNDDYNAGWYSPMGPPQDDNKPDVGNVHWGSKYGVDESTSVWVVAWKNEGVSGAGAGSLAVSNVNTDNGTGVQADIVPNESPNGVITAPGQSGLQTGAHALAGTEGNPQNQNPGTGTDDADSPGYQFSQDVNLTSIEYSGNGEENVTLGGDGLLRLNAKLGMPANPGEATLTTDPGVTGDGATDGGDGTEVVGGPGGEDGNVQGSGNKDNPNDPANGDVEDEEKPVETPEEEAKRIAQQQQEQELAKLQEQRREEEEANKLVA